MEPEVSVGAGSEWTPLQYSWRRTSSASGSILGRRRRRHCWVLRRIRNSLSESAVLTWEPCNVHADGGQVSCVDCVVYCGRCHSVGAAGKFSSWQQLHFSLSHMHWVTSFLRFRIPLIIQNGLSTAECVFIDNSCLKGKVVRIHAMKADCGSSGIAPLILYLDAGWEWPASRSTRFIPRKEPRCQLNKRLGGPHSQSGRIRQDRNLLPLPAFDPRTVQPVAQ